ncbi:MAG: leucine-rich repeat protein [Oscillospiraceae bacterium]|nr:leucine-rich repeat protein [Oscillospiraceae bacterium]
MTIPDNVTIIGNSAFESCDSLKNVTIGSSVTIIGDYAFQTCSALTSVTIPDSVSWIGSYVFYGCHSLTSFTVSPGNTKYSSDADGVLYNKDKTVLIRHPADNIIASYAIPAGVRSISEAAFEDCRMLTSVTIGMGVTSISNDAFLSTNLTFIYGIGGTYAETYANRAGKVFVDQQVLAQSVALNKTVLTLAPHDRETLEATVLPEDASHQDVTWSTSNSAVATVSGGVVTARDPGSAIITATTRNGKTATCTVTVTSGWHEIDSYWYYFWADGQRRFGLQTIDGKQYYFTAPDGQMKTGWQWFGDSWFYLDPADGHALTGLQYVAESDGYYFFSASPSCQTLTGWQTIDGKQYYFGGSHGRMLTGWQTIGGKTYYFEGADGQMLTGWQKLDGSWCYLDPADGHAYTGLQYVAESDGYFCFNASPSCSMVTGWQTIGGKQYYFRGGDSGRMLTGWQELGSNWYYFQANGQMLTGWQKLGGAWFYLDPADGHAYTGLQYVAESDGYFYFNASPSCRMMTGWQTIHGKQYYFRGGDSGRTLTGWQELGSSWYYFQADGQALTGWQKLGGAWFYLDPADGHALTGLQYVAESDGYFCFNASPSCCMLTGWQTIGGEQHYFQGGDSGRMVS